MLNGACSFNYHTYSRTGSPQWTATRATQMHSGEIFVQNRSRLQFQLFARVARDQVIRDKEKPHVLWKNWRCKFFFFFSFGHCQSHNRRKFNSMSSDFLGVCCFSPSSYCLIGKNEKKSLFALEREMTPANSGCSAIIVKNLNESPICRAAFPLLSFFSLII